VKQKNLKSKKILLNTDAINGKRRKISDYLPLYNSATIKVKRCSKF
jgi:hypothetical protein